MNWPWSVVFIALLALWVQVFEAKVWPDCWNTPCPLSTCELCKRLKQEYNSSCKKTCCLSIQCTVV